MSGRNFSLTNHLSDFVDAQVSSGRHQNASEVVREALRRYEDDILVERANLVALEEMVSVGIAAIERGDYVTINSEDDHLARMGRLLTEARKRTTARRSGND